MPRRIDAEQPQPGACRHRHVHEGERYRDAGAAGEDFVQITIARVAIIFAVAVKTFHLVQHIADRRELVGHAACRFDKCRLCRTSDAQSVQFQQATQAIDGGVTLGRQFQQPLDKVDVAPTTNQLLELRIDAEIRQGHGNRDQGWIEEQPRRNSSLWNCIGLPPADNVRERNSYRAMPWPSEIAGNRSWL